MIRSSCPTAGLTRQTVIAAIVLASSLRLAAGASGAQRLSEDDEVRLAAFRHLAGTLLPIDSSAVRTSCFEVIDTAEFEAPPAKPGDDPSPALLALLTRLGPRIVPRSECDVSPPVVGNANPAVIVDRPVVYGVGKPVRAAGRVRIPVTYYIHGTNGGGWLCTAVRAGRGWRIADCLPTWIS